MSLALAGRSSCARSASSSRPSPRTPPTPPETKVHEVATITENAPSIAFSVIVKLQTLRRFVSSFTCEWACLCWGRRGSEQRKQPSGRSRSTEVRKELDWPPVTMITEEMFTCNKCMFCINSQHLHPFLLALFLFGKKNNV